MRTEGLMGLDEGKGLRAGVEKEDNDRRMGEGESRGGRMVEE